MDTHAKNRKGAKKSGSANTAVVTDDLSLSKLKKTVRDSQRLLKKVIANGNGKETTARNLTYFSCPRTCRPIFDKSMNVGFKPFGFNSRVRV
jgi:hypothetical protein